MKIKVVLIIAEVIILTIAAIYVVSALDYAFADEIEYYIMCQPDSFVNVRFAPKKESEEIGFLELGDSFKTDGEKRNGFIKVLDELGNKRGWVSIRYVVTDKPTIETFVAKNVSRGRVSCRRYINGPRRKWLKYGSIVTVYAYSEEWAVTNQGFIKIRCLEAQ